MREEIKKLIQKAIEGLGGKEVEVLLERPADAAHGDYSTNVALILAKQLGKNPRETAEDIVSKLQTNKSTKIHDRSFLYFIEKVEVADPGFINFFISKEYLFKELAKILKEKEKYGAQDVLKGKKVMVEFTDPNPFKEFHIGHLYSNIVGEALSRIFEANGAKVQRVNYQGDVGMHVAKAVWGMKKLMEEEKTNLPALEKKSLDERAKFLGQAYAKGAKAFEENEQAASEITELNTKIFELHKDIKELYEKGKKWSLECFEKIYKRLGTKFDRYYFESNVGKVGIGIVEEGLKKGIFEKSQGAIIFSGEKYGLHSRVFINSKGLPTYEAKELGLAPAKYKDFAYDLSVIVTGNDIVEYFKVLLAALKKINPALAEKTRHLSHGMVRLPEGKMSSRTGNVITGEELINETKSRVLALMNSLGSAVSEKERESAAESIAQAAVKYSFLRISLGRDIVFDFEKSLSIEGESGPYIQYTYARCQSILHKSEIRISKFLPTGQAGETNSKFKIQNITLHKEELAILRLLPKFGEVVQEAAEKFAPNLLCNFAFELAQSYNLFYNTHPVLNAETVEAREFRLGLTAAAAQIIKNSLSLLGIKTLEKM